VLLLVVTLLAAGPAETEARKHFEAGRALYEVNRFAEATEEFEAGYALAPRPLFLFNSAQANRRLGEATKSRPAMLRAKQRYLDYLREAGPREPEREQATEYIESLEAWLATNPEAAVVLVPEVKPALMLPTAPPPAPELPGFFSRNPWFLPVVAGLAVAGGVAIGLGVRAATTGCGAATLGCVDAR
jgi:tetratricopeptide (TPR) repeat protein